MRPEVSKTFCRSRCRQAEAEAENRGEPSRGVCLVGSAGERKSLSAAAKKRVLAKSCWRRCRQSSLHFCTCYCWCCCCWVCGGETNSLVVVTIGQKSRRRDMARWMIMPKTVGRRKKKTKVSAGCYLLLLLLLLLMLLAFGLGMMLA